MRQDSMKRLSRYRLRLLPTSVAIFLLHTLVMADFDPNQMYLVLSTSRTTTLQEEIDEATAEGFRIVATASRGGGQVVLMRRC